MMKEGNMDVLEELREAGDVGTRGERLRELSEHEEVEVRRAVAGNANTPWETLEKLAWEFPREFLGNPVGMVQMLGRPEEMFADFKDDEYEDFIDKIMQQEDLPKVWLQWFQQHHMFQQCENLSMNVKVAGEIVDREQGIGECRVREMLARYERTPQEELRTFMADEESHVRLGVARNKALTRDIAQFMLHDASMRVRVELAKNEQTPPEILACLIKDEKRFVRAGVAYNSAVSADLLMMLAGDTDELVRSLVAMNSETPVEVVRMLAGDTSARVRFDVLKNKQLPEDVLHSLMS